MFDPYYLLQSAGQGFTLLSLDDLEEDALMFFLKLLLLMDVLFFFKFQDVLVDGLTFMGFKAFSWVNLMLLLNDEPLVSTVLPGTWADGIFMFLVGIAAVNEIENSLKFISQRLSFKSTV